MVHRSIVIALLAAVQVYAVPLNINLGAYSPALVVGDGEISLGGAAEASTLMATLATGAANAAQANGNGEQGQQGQQGQQGEQQGEGAPSPPLEAAVDVPTDDAADVDDGNPAAAIRKGLEPGSLPNVKRDVDADAVAAARKLKVRDFQQALDYAKEAMKNQPKVELGTGEGGSGVGIIVGPGLNVPVESAANGAKPNGGEAGQEKAKRAVDEAEAPKRGITLLAMMEI